eukprot:1393773-Amorphochlora_amoeboformis.AAC.1
MGCLDIQDVGCLDSYKGSTPSQTPAFGRLGVLTVKTWGVLKSMRGVSLTVKTWDVLTVNVWGVLTMNMWGVFLLVYKV